MTALPATLPRRTPAAQSRPRPAPLRLVAPAPKRRGRALFIVVCVLVLGGGLGTGFVLNTQMAKGSFEQHRLETKLADLQEHRTDVIAQINQAAAPAALSKAAKKLGMRPADGVGYIRLKDGKVIGNPLASASASASASAAASAAGTDSDSDSDSAQTTSDNDSGAATTSDTNSTNSARPTDTDTDQGADQ